MKQSNQKADVEQTPELGLDEFDPQDGASVDRAVRSIASLEDEDVDGKPTGATGQSAAESSDDDGYEPELNDSTIRQMPKPMRAIANKLLAIEQAMARGGSRQTEAQNAAAEEAIEEIELDLGEMPVGYEGIADKLAEIANHLNKKIVDLQRAQKAVEKRSETRDTEIFEQTHPDWTKHKDRMQKICEQRGTYPQTLRQMETLLRDARDQEELETLRSERERGKANAKAASKAGPAPRLNAAKTSTRDRLETTPGARPTLRDALRLAARQMVNQPTVRGE